MKAVLVMDAPESCGYCDLRSTGFYESSLFEFSICSPTRKDVDEYQCQPSFCPLVIVKPGETYQIYGDDQ